MLAIWMNLVKPVLIGECLGLKWGGTPGEYHEIADLHKCICQTCCCMSPIACKLGKSEQGPGQASNRRLMGADITNSLWIPPFLLCRVGEPRVPENGDGLGSPMENI